MTPSPWPLTIGSLLLRYAVEADLDDLLTLRNEPAVNRFTIRTSEDPATFDSKWLAIPASPTDFSCVAIRNEQLVGIGFLDVIDGLGQPGMPHGTGAVIGYIVHPTVWGEGVATDLTRGLLWAAFDTLGTRRVIATCNVDNPASARVLEKCGMRRELHGIQDCWHAELGWVDSYGYAMLAHEWAARTSAESQRGSRL